MRPQSVNATMPGLEKNPGFLVAAWSGRREVEGIASNVFARFQTQPAGD
jgi:hypothetical protein